MVGNTADESDVTVTWIHLLVYRHNRKTHNRKSEQSFWQKAPTILTSFKSCPGFHNLLLHFVFNDYNHKTPGINWLLCFYVSNSASLFLQKRNYEDCVCFLVFLNRRWTEGGEAVLDKLARAWMQTGKLFKKKQGFIVGNNLVTHTWQN